MTTHKLRQNKNKKVKIPKHPLAKLAGKFEGEFWENTLEEMKRFREIEKEQINKDLDKSLNQE